MLQVERCVDDCSGFEMVRECRNPAAPGERPGGPDWPEYCAESDELPGGYACLPCACVPNERRCSVVDDVAVLEECGVKCDCWRQVQACDEGHFCRDQDDDAGCFPWVCVPGRSRCEAGLRLTCNDEGSGIEEVEDCAPGLCDADLGECVECEIGRAHV